MTFLCRHKSGVYYYRKTFITPLGKRKENRRSLKTADFKQAQYLALKLVTSCLAEVVETIPALCILFDCDVADDCWDVELFITSKSVLGRGGR